MHFNNLFDRVNIDPERTNVPNGMEPDAEKECGRYEELIRSLGGVDLQLLGLGHNDIGFSSSGEAFEKETHCVDLTESTIEANKRFFASADTMQNRHIRWEQDDHAGKEDPDSSERRKQGRYRRSCVSLALASHPGSAISILQLHNDVTLVGDEAFAVPDLIQKGCGCPTDLLQISPQLLPPETWMKRADQLRSAPFY